MLSGPTIGGVCFDVVLQWRVGAMSGPRTRVGPFLVLVLVPMLAAPVGAQESPSPAASPAPSPAPAASPAPAPSQAPAASPAPPGACCQPGACSPSLLPPPASRCSAGRQRPAHRGGDRPTPAGGPDAQDPDATIDFPMSCRFSPGPARVPYSIQVRDSWPIWSGPGTAVELPLTGGPASERKSIGAARFDSTLTLRQEEDQRPAP